MKNTDNRTRLDDLLRDYEVAQLQQAALKTRRDQLKEEILHEMQLTGQNKYKSADNINAALQEKELIRYTDEAKMITALKNLSLDDYIKAVPDATKLNKELRANTSLAASLKEFYADQKITALTVKKLTK